MKLYLFDRTENIIHYEDLSILDSKRRIENSAEVIMSENEVFVFQLALLPDCDDVIEKISYTGNIKISCINTDVVDKYGKSKTQKVSLKRNVIQPLFFTADRSEARSIW